MVRTTSSLNSSLDALAAVEPGFARVLELHGRPDPRKSEPGVETLLRTIVGQQVSVAAARSRKSPKPDIGGSDLRVTPRPN